MLLLQVLLMIIMVVVVVVVMPVVMAPVLAVEVPVALIVLGEEWRDTSPWKRWRWGGAGVGCVFCFSSAGTLGPREVR